MFTLKNSQIEFDLEADDALLDAAIVSLYTNAAASQEETFINQDQGGYWGDLLASDASLGSKLWTLGREVKSVEVLGDHEEYALNALHWMKRDGLFESVNALCTYDKDRLQITIRLDEKEFEVVNG